jgi:hypothetical protein
MAQLKAFVRIDGTGRVVPGTLLLRYKKPGVGNWMEIDSTECCNSVISPKVAYISCRGVEPCAGRCSTVTIYLSQSCIDNPQVGCQVWANEAGTVPVVDGTYAIILPGSKPPCNGYMIVVDGVANFLNCC